LDFAWRTRDAQNAGLKKQNDELKARLDVLENLVKGLTTRRNGSEEDSKAAP